ncbi:MAG TPA: HPF/RaiA family ribosome-associated protein [Gemmatimonadales bacterium]|nr:HPF/RaiA family ribosome-associated protein [Gemmatimonadales bacterium]
MLTTISARHCEVTENLRERTRAVSDRLEKLSPHALEATVIFGLGANPQSYQVEIRLHARARKVLVGIGEGPDHRTALDRAEEKLRPQLEKVSRTRQRARRAPAQDS